MGETKGSRKSGACDTSFLGLINRVRHGDDQAATALVERYQSHILRVVRVRMTDASLRRKLDSADICQSVLANFFVRVALGEFEVDSPQQLIGLLSAMARNQIRKEVEREHAGRRDVRRLEKLPADELDCADTGPTPSSIVANRELLSEFRRRLGPLERYLADQRAQGRGWSELADELGVGANALRMRFSRSLDRIAQEMGVRGTRNGCDDASG